MSVWECSKTGSTGVFISVFKSLRDYHQNHKQSTYLARVEMCYVYGDEEGQERESEETIEKFYEKYRKLVVSKYTCEHSRTDKFNWKQNGYDQRTTTTKNS